MFGKRGNSFATSLGNKFSRLATWGKKLENILNPIVALASPLLLTNPIGQAILAGTAGLNVINKAAHIPKTIYEQFSSKVDDMKNDARNIQEHVSDTVKDIKKKTIQRVSDTVEGIKQDANDMIYMNPF